MGHIHHQTAKEIGGMVFESFNTLAAPDGWHSDSGYGAKRSMTCIVFDGNHGEIQRHKVGIGQLTKNWYNKILLTLINRLLGELCQHG